jgi:dsRNA-specific ribonuclease
MTHKSFKEHFNTTREHQSHIEMHIEDYERLEFLGDSILNFLIAQYYFDITRDRPLEFQPKQLHKLKTSVVNNVFLSLVVVQRGVHNFVLYNQNSEQFKKQYDQYVEVVTKIL